MGDADVPVNILRNPDMDEALEDMEEQINGLFYYIDMLQSRTSQIMSQRICCQNFHRQFAMLNLLALPMIFAIIIAYGTDGMITSESMIQNAVETSIYILMFVSSFIGLPLYLFTIWDLYVNEDNADYSSINNVSVRDHEDEIFLPELMAERENVNNTAPSRQPSRFFHPPQHRPEREDSSIEEVEEQERVDPVESFKFKTSNDSQTTSKTDLPVAFKGNSTRLTFQRYLDYINETSDSDTSCSESSRKSYEGMMVMDNLLGNRLVDSEKNDNVTPDTKCSEILQKSYEDILMMGNLENQLVDGEKNNELIEISAVDSMESKMKTETRVIEIPITHCGRESNGQVTI